MNRPSLHVAFIQGADISYSTTNGAALANLTVATSAAVFPGVTQGVGFAIIQPAQTMALAATVPKHLDTNTVVASVQVWGTIDGNSFESQAFKYPVTVCNGCLIEDKGVCTGMGGGGELGNPCNDAQDTKIACCNVGTPTQQCPPQ
jgi:hypothetical protein